jgi:Tfp pilus assembly PilM family ATPase
LINTSINLTQKKVRILCTDAKNEIIFLKEEDSNVDFSEDVSIYGNNFEIINELAEIISNALKSENIPALNARLILDVNQFFINSVPVETFDAESLKSYIIWDISNFYPDIYKNFVVNYHKIISSKETQDILGDYKILTISIRNNCINFINELFRRGNLTIEKIDIDLFALNNLFKTNPGVSSKLIMNCYKNRIDYLIMNGNSLLCYDYIYFKDNNFDIELENNIKRLNSRKEFEMVKNIYISGEDYSEYVLNEIKKFYGNKEISIINPLNFLKTGENLSNKEALSNSGYKFASVAGALV